MKIVFTGGGTGGHFYPLIAVAEALKDAVKERKIIEPEVYFFGPSAFDDRALFENGIAFVETPAGKLRRYFSIANFFDTFKTFFGIIQTGLKLYRLYPDVVFSKGGYGSVPTVMAAKFLRIPVVVHDSDAVPGRTTLLAIPFAKKVGISYPEAIEYIPEKFRDKVALTGNPVRAEVREPAREGAREFLELEDNVPVVMVIGGSLGAEKLNDVILSALPDLVMNYQVIHQTGQSHFADVTAAAQIVLERNERRYRYKAYGYLSSLAMKMSAGAADLVISRAGSGAIAEISAWGKASIIVPIPTSVSRDQRENAYAYARGGAAVVIEETNLSPHLLISEIDRLFKNPKARTDLADAAKKFAKPDAAKVLANALLDTALEHET